MKKANLENVFVLVNEKGILGGMLHFDFDKVQEMADRHNENFAGLEPKQFAVSAKDFVTMRPEMMDYILKNLPKAEGYC